MKIILTAVNAKYIHSNLAVYTLQASAEKAGVFPEIREFTINQSKDSMLRSLFLEHADVVCVSCYIWNISIVEDLITEYHKISPETKIWLGGPEVSYHAEEMLEQYPFLDGIMKGEGEITFRELAVYYQNQENGTEGKTLEEIHGITYRDAEGAIKSNPWRPAMDLSEVDFPYANLKKFENRIIYYESSRGCPFSCSYCLSSIDKRLRFRNLELVKKELAFFLEHKVPQVKFVDRTFNCKKDHAMEIWKFIAEHDNGVTNFHFEIAADILNEEELELLEQMRPGLVQLEIGVQSTNQDTIKAIHRVMNLDKLRNNVTAIRKCRNIHMHLDLIAGLPYEDINSFRKSFNDIYDMKPDNLQLGFLKLLHGSLMREEKDKYGIVARDIPPYEVLYTKYLSYDDILKLKQVEKVLDMYYNSNMFVLSVRYLSGSFDDSFAMYELLSECFERRYSDGSLPSRNGKFELLYDFAGDYLNEHDMMVFGELLRFDMYLRDNVKSLPECFAFNKDESLRAKKYSGEHKLTKAEHIEIFKINPVEYRDNGNVVCGDTVIYFDYLIRDYDNNATIKILEETK